MGYGLENLTKRLGMTQAGAGDAIKREKCISEENDYRVPHFTLKLNKNKAAINILKYRLLEQMPIVSIVFSISN